MAGRAEMGHRKNLATQQSPVRGSVKRFSPDPMKEPHRHGQQNLQISLPRVCSLLTAADVKSSLGAPATLINNNYFCT